MKGSIFRKRYVLIYGENLSQKIRLLEKELYRIYRSKRKYSENNYAIFLTNQFYKESLTEFISKNFKDVEILTVSGTIKKCKTIIKRHKEQQSIEQNLGSIS